MNLVETLQVLVGDKSERGRKLAEVSLIAAKNEILAAHQWSFLRDMRTVEVSQNSATVPQDVLEITSIFYKNNELLYRPLGKVLKDQEIKSSSPAEFSVYANNIVFAPSVDEDYSVDIYFIKRAFQDFLTPFNPSPIPEELYDLLLDAGYYRFMRQVSGLGEIAEVKQKYMTRLAEAIQRDVAASSPKDIHIKNYWEEEW